METQQIISAAAVWKDFDETQNPLEVSVLAEFEKDGLLQTQVFFDGRKLPDGNAARVFARVFRQPSEEKLPVLVVIAASGQRVPDEEACLLAQQGYAVIVPDNTGESDFTRHTIYPESINYANFCFSGRHLTHCDETPFQTSWFEWAANTRRAISFMCEQPYADKKAVGLVGKGDGTIIACMVAAFDTRVKSCAVLSGSCWVEPSGKEEDSESFDRWLAGIAPQSYMMFMRTPFYFCCGLNSSETDIDKTYKALMLIPPEVPKAMLLFPGATQHSGTDWQGNLEKWFSMTLGKNKKKLPAFPTVAFAEKNGKLFTEVSASKQAVSAKVFAASEIANKRARYWAESTAESAGAGKFRAATEVLEAYPSKCCFGNVTFADGFVMSSGFATIREPQLKEMKITEFAQSGKIIYRGSSGQMPFVSFDWQHCDMSSSEQMLSVKAGPFGISGVEGTSIATFALNDGMFINNEASALTFDVYSEKPQTLQVCYVRQYGMPEQQLFSASAELLGGELWQKVSLDPSEFHSEVERPPVGWSECQVLVFTAENAFMLNNVIFT